MTLYKATDKGNIPLTAEEVAELEALRIESIAVAAIQAAEQARTERNKRLTESDSEVIQLLEQGLPVPASKRNYRQALRDISKQAGFPHTINWPNKA